MGCPHHVDPRSIEDRIVGGLDIDHEKLRDDIVWICVNRERDSAERSSLVPIKPIQVVLSLRVAHVSGRLWGILLSV